MKIVTKFNIGDVVYFLSHLGEIEGGIISKISIDVNKRDKYIYYLIDCFNKNLCCTSKCEDKIYTSIEELEKNIEKITATIYKYV